MSRVRTYYPLVFFVVCAALLLTEWITPAQARSLEPRLGRSQHVVESIESGTGTPAPEGAVLKVADLIAWK